MPSHWRDAHGSPHTHRHEHPLKAGEKAHGPALYEIALREAIATQHALARADRLDLRACESCCKPYLLATVWQPLSDEGAIVCPRCGTEAVAWEGARGFVAYWQRDATLPGRMGVSRVPAARSSRIGRPPAASPRGARS